MQIKNYEGAVKYLESFIGKVIFKIDPKSIKLHLPLDRMKMLLSLLDNPQDKFKSVLIGGTSGKGSTAYLISHILTTAGCKTGLTISPHLQKINERIQINGKQISDEKFTEMVSSLVQTIELMKKMPASPQGGAIGEPSYFEILIGMAFLHFAKEKVDIAVVEVGMGGEFDGTNTLNPLIAILTNVGLDHTNILGKTVEKIAKTKAGIIKPFGVLSKVIPPASAPSSGSVRAVGSPSPFATPLVIVSGVKQPSVVKIVENRCTEIGSKLNLLWRDFGYKIKKESASGTDFDFISHEETLDNLKLSLLGQYQAENASLAIKTILELRKLGFKVKDETVKKALSTAFFPGRFEVKELKIKNYKLKIVLDGAHNPTKMNAFLTTLKKLFPKERKIFIVGFKFDKEIKKMLKQIVTVADILIVTEFRAKTDMNIHASADAESIKKDIKILRYEDTKVKIEKDSGKALKMGLKTIQQSNNATILVVTGSLYLVGEIRNKL